MVAISKGLHRRSIRLNGYDYTQPGAYFVTVVTYQRICMFGNVIDGTVRLSNYGEIVAQTWIWLARQYAFVDVLSFIVMPNHCHAILLINELEGFCRGGSRPAPTKIDKIKPLGQIIGAFKTRSAKQINLLRATPGLPISQRNYYDHIIRNQSEMETIGKYILMNPVQWPDDPEYFQ